MKIIILISLIFILIGCKQENKNERVVSLENVNKGLEDNFENNKTSEKHSILSLKDSVMYLKKYYENFLKNKDSISEKQFFYLFPDNFKKFNALYGFINEKEMPLYSNSEHITGYYNNRLYVSEVEYCDKILNVCKGGKWEADNVSLLQDIVNEIIHNNKEIFIQKLLKMEKIEKKALWFFYFDGPIQEKEKLDSLKIILPEKEYLIAVEAFNDVTDFYK